MAINNPYQAYQQNSANTASPGDLTLMLFNGCLKFLKLAKKAMQEKKPEEKNTNLLKAQNIIQELMVTLNTDIELSQSLMQLYDYLHHRLVEANIHNDIEMISEVEEFIVQFRDTWKQVVQLHRQEQHGQGQSYGK